MLPHTPLVADWIFGPTTLLTVWLFYRATDRNRTALLLVLGWMALHAGLGLSGFYQTTNTLPPRAALMVGPPLLLLVGLLLTTPGRHFLDSLRLDRLTLLHVVRVPVELVLWALYAGPEYVPEVMTFDGRNFDVLSGLTAPLVYYFGYVRKRVPIAALIAWNVVCFGLLLNIIVIAILAVPSPFAQFAPNIAVLYFPFVWLPSVVVPIVMLAHVAALRQLTRRNLSKRVTVTEAMR